MVLDWHDIAREHREELLREAERWRLSKALSANRRELRSRGLEWFMVWLRDGGGDLVEIRYGLSGFCGRKHRQEHASSPRSDRRCSA